MRFFRRGIDSYWLKLRIYIVIYYASSWETSLQKSLDKAADCIGLHVKQTKRRYMCFNQKGDTSTLNGGSLKLVDKFTNLGSSVSSSVCTSSIGWSTRTYLKQLCPDTGCSLEDQPETVDDRDKRSERERESGKSMLARRHDDDIMFILRLKTQNLLFRANTRTCSHKHLPSLWWRYVHSERKNISKHTFLWTFLCNGIKHISLDYRYNFLSVIPCQIWCGM